MYQALYRKYRPRTFDDVAGQQRITDTLRAQVISGRLSHAYLFIGTRGTGKTTCAKILAKAVNCEHPVNGSPCNECASCRGIEDGTIMDVVEIDAASNNGVDNVRALRDEAIYSPASVKKRVYIIDEVHMLSLSAFNALLKILEEPPEHLMFILATTELRKVPATILSRCQRYSFRRLDSEVIADRLSYVAGRESLDLTPDAAALLGRLADGAMRDGLSLLDQCSGVERIDKDAVLASLGLSGSIRTTQMLEKIAGGDAKGALELFSELWAEGKDPSSLLGDLCSLMRDVLMYELAPSGGRELLSGAYDVKTLKSISGKFTRAELLRAMERTQEALVSLRDNPSPRTAVEICLVSLCDPKLCGGIPELSARLSRLEESGVRQAAVAESRVPVPEPFVPPAPMPQPEPEPEFERVYQPPEPEPEPVYYEPEPEPEYVPDNAPGEEPAPEPQAAPAEPASGNMWDRLVPMMKGRIPIGLFTMLGDPLQVRGEFLGNDLRISADAAFAFGMLNRPAVLDSFRAAASELTGGGCRVTVETMDSKNEIESRSLEELQKFTQVKFK